MSSPSAAVRGSGSDESSNILRQNEQQSCVDNAENERQRAATHTVTSTGSKHTSLSAAGSGQLRTGQHRSRATTFDARRRLQASKPNKKAPPPPSASSTSSHSPSEKGHHPWAQSVSTPKRPINKAPPPPPPILASKSQETSSSGPESDQHTQHGQASADHHGNTSADAEASSKPDTPSGSRTGSVSEGSGRNARSSSTSGGATSRVLIHKGRTVTHVDALHELSNDQRMNLLLAVKEGILDKGQAEELAEQLAEAVAACDVGRVKDLMSKTKRAIPRAADIDISTPQDPSAVQQLPAEFHNLDQEQRLAILTSVAKGNLDQDEALRLVNEYLQNTYLRQEQADASSGGEEERTNAASPQPPSSAHDRRDSFDGETGRRTRSLGAMNLFRRKKRGSTHGIHGRASVSDSLQGSNRDSPMHMQETDGDERKLSTASGMSESLEEEIAMDEIDTGISGFADAFGDEEEEAFGGSMEFGSTVEEVAHRHGSLSQETVDDVIASALRVVKESTAVGGDDGAAATTPAAALQQTDAEDANEDPTIGDGGVQAGSSITSSQHKGDDQHNNPFESDSPAHREDSNATAATTHHHHTSHNNPFALSAETGSDRQSSTQALETASNSAGVDDTNSSGHGHAGHTANPFGVAQAPPKKASTGFNPFA